MKISQKQMKINAQLYQLKKNLPCYCFICHKQKPLTLAHVLPRSLAPEHITNPNNVVGLCIECHDRYDNDISFRKEQESMYKLAVDVDNVIANRYFHKY